MVYINHKPLKPLYYSFKKNALLEANNTFFQEDEIMKLIWFCSPIGRRNHRLLWKVSSEKKESSNYKTTEEEMRAMNC
jgi:hypothetical protein